MLYDLLADMGETTDVAAKHSEVVAWLLGYVERARGNLGDKLTERVGGSVREPGRIK